MEVETDLVNGYDILPGEVLESACEESLREEKPTDPEDFRSAIGDPVLEESYSLFQVNDPASQWLHRQKPYISPHSWHLVVVQAVG
jgi:hypothetical protein